MPFDVISQHAQKHMGADPAGQPMMNGAHMQIDSFQTAERSFHSAELFVAAHHLRCRHGFGRDVGANHVDAVQLLFPLDALGPARVTKAIFFDVDLIVLAYFEAPQHTAHTKANRVLAA